MIAVNGTEISDAAIDAEVQYHPAESFDTARRAAAEALVIREVLLQEAARQGIESTTPEETIERLLEAAIVTPEPDETTCRRYFDNNRRRFRSPDLFEAQHILLAAAPDDAEARAAAKQKAQILLARIETAPESFEDLARAHSACPSSAAGGHLGQVARGSTVPEFETFLCSLEDGELCAAPVETRYGYHVVRLLRRHPGRDLPFEAARERIAEYLREHVWRTAVRQYIAILAGRMSIEGVEIGAASPLVQ
jgi:peptidyl-prolyl cis-trans isomerase C